jgi:hypothetical protein
VGPGDMVPPIPPRAHWESQESMRRRRLLGQETAGNNGVACHRLNPSSRDGARRRGPPVSEGQFARPNCSSARPRVPRLGLSSVGVWAISSYVNKIFRKSSGSGSGTLVLLFFRQGFYISYAIKQTERHRPIVFP